MKRPSLAKVINIILEGMMNDGLDMDIERVKSVNKLIENNLDKSHKRKVDTFFIRPHTDLSFITTKHLDDLPKGTRYFSEKLGEREDLSRLYSYILFEGKYQKELVKSGYDRCMESREDIIEFFS
jgi:NTE family protein